MTLKGEITILHSHYDYNTQGYCWEVTIDDSEKSRTDFMTGKEIIKAIREYKLHYRNQKINKIIDEV